MLPSKRVAVPNDGSSHLIVQLPPGSGVYDVLITNTGSNPADIGDQTVAAGAGYPVAGAATPPPIRLPAGDSMYAASGLGTVIAVAISDAHGPF